MARLEISKDEEHKDHHLAVGYQAPARGYFSSDLEPVSAILGVAEDVRLRNRKEKIRGVECYVVEANTGNGDYTVWFDPEHGYNIRRAEVHKRGDDTWYGKPLSRPPAKRTEFTFELENVECQEIGGHWIPVRAEWETTTKYESGRRQAAKHIYKLDNLDTSPDFEDIGAFAPDVRNGTKTIIEGENPAIPLYWQDGEARPKVPGGLQNE